MPLQNIKKRDNSIVTFDQEKITKAIWKAAQSVGGTDQALAQKISNQVTVVLEVFFKNGESIPTVEQIQDLVEKILIEDGHAKTAKAYILYRQKQTEIRQKKEEVLGKIASTKFSLQALKYLKHHFLQRAEDGTTIETPEEMLERVAKSVAKADINYKDSHSQQSWKKFYSIMVNLDFVPHGTILANAGTPHQQLLSHFELNVEDTMESIFEEIKHAVLIYQNGGKALIKLGEVRPKGTSVTSTKGPASGPVAFLKIFDSAISAIKQASKQGSLTAILPIDHPDILEFLSCTEEAKKLEHFQLQIEINQNFIDALLQQKEYELVNPQTKEIINKLDAKSVFDIIVAKISHSQNISLVFTKEVLRAFHQKTPLKTNRKAELPKYRISSNGSVNIANFTESGEIQWQKLQDVIHSAIHFLDNIFDVSQYPSKKIAEESMRERNIQLGLFGFAEFLDKLNIKSTSEKARELAEKIASFLTTEAINASQNLAQSRGGINSEENKRRNVNLTALFIDSMASTITEKTIGIELKQNTNDPESGIRLQSIFQKNIQGTVENTVFFPQNIHLEDLKKIVLLAYQTGCQNIRLAKNTTSYIFKDDDEQIELPFLKEADENTSKKPKPPLQKTEEERNHRSIIRQKAEEVVLPPIIANH